MGATIRRTSTVLVLALILILVAGCLGSPKNTEAVRIVVSEVGGINEMDVQIQSVSGTSVLHENTDTTQTKTFYKATVYDDNNNVIYNEPITWALTEDLGKITSQVDPSLISFAPERAGLGTVKATARGGANGELEIVVYKSAVLGQSFPDGFSFSEGLVSDQNLADVWIDVSNNTIRLKNAAVAAKSINEIDVITNGLEFSPIALRRANINMNTVYIVKFDDNQYAKLKLYSFGGPTSHQINNIEFMYAVSDNTGEFPY